MERRFGSNDDTKLDPNKTIPFATTVDSSIIYRESSPTYVSPGRLWSKIMVRINKLDRSYMFNADVEYILIKNIVKY